MLNHRQNAVDFKDYRTPRISHDTANFSLLGQMSHSGVLMNTLG